MIVAAAQAESAAGDVPANVVTAARLATRAADLGARVVVLPEAFLTGYDVEVFAGALPTLADLTGALDPVRDAAIRGDITVVASSALQRDGRRTLSSVLVAPDGTVTAPYDKQHLDADERPFFTAGDSGASTTIEGMQWGLSICYDGSFPEHARAAAVAGAVGYFASVAYFPGGEHRLQLAYAARALDNGMYVVVSGLVGRCGHRDFIGGSAIYGPDGRALTAAGDGEEVIVAEVDPEVVTATRTRRPLLEDLRRS